MPLFSSYSVDKKRETKEMKINLHTEEIVSTVNVRYFEEFLQNLAVIFRSNTDL